MAAHKLRSNAETPLIINIAKQSSLLNVFLSPIAAFSMVVLVASCASPVDDNDSTSTGKETGIAQMSDSRVDRGQAQAEMPNVAEVRRDAAGGILSVKGANLSSDLDSNTSYRELANKGLRGDQAVYFLNFYRHEFRLSDPRVEFVPDGVQQDDLGFTQVRLSQRIGSLPVRNAQIVIQFSPEGAINLVQGHYLAGRVQYELVPTVDLTDATQTILSEVGQQPNLKYSGLSVLLQGAEDSKLVHEFFVTKSTTDKFIFSVDAHSNQIISKAPVVLTK